MRVVPGRYESESHRCMGLPGRRKEYADQSMVGGGHMPFLNVTGLIAGILAIVGGVVVIVWPRILAYIIGVYLIIVGILAVIAALR